MERYELLKDREKSLSLKESEEFDKLKRIFHKKMFAEDFFMKLLPLNNRWSVNRVNFSRKDEIIEIDIKYDTAMGIFIEDVGNVTIDGLSEEYIEKHHQYIYNMPVWIYYQIPFIIYNDKKIESLPF